MCQYMGFCVPSCGTPVARLAGNEARLYNGPCPEHGDTPLGCLVQWKATRHPEEKETS